ncbi:hypothetical protein E2I00_019013, partial [Balaenoptera physalus]
KQLLCDVVIVAEDVEIEAHRVVLAACSPYFCAMFTGDMSESKAKKIEIKDVDGQTLSKLIDYIYTAEIEVTEENVQVLLPAASLLQLMDVRQNCCDFLQSQLHPTNCLGIRAFADVHTCTDLLQQANAYAEVDKTMMRRQKKQCEGWFGGRGDKEESPLQKSFIKKKSSCQLELWAVLRLQGDPQKTRSSAVTMGSLIDPGAGKLVALKKLVLEHEALWCVGSKVFEAVISWINYEKETRLEHMAKLMEHVRLPLLPRDYLVQTVEEEALIKNNNTCKDFLIEAMKYHLLPLDQRLLIKNPRTKPRTPVSLPKSHKGQLGLPEEKGALKESYRKGFTGLEKHLVQDQIFGFSEVMIVVGGQAPKAIRSVECYDFEEDRWDQIAELPSRRCRAGVVFMAGHVYAVGGFNGSLRVRTVDVYDGVKDQWTSIASMQERRSTLGAAVLNDLLYAVGGFDGSTGRSRTQSPSSLGHSFHATLLQSENQKLLVDMDLERLSPGLASVEAYSYKTNEWFFVAPMNTRRSSVGVGVVEGKLYAVGGYDGASRQCLSTVEQYNPATNEWTYVADMSTRRSGAGMGRGKVKGQAVSDL